MTLDHRKYICVCA